MPWVRETKDNPIIDSTLGVLTTWDGVEFKWDEIITGKWKKVFGRESKPASGWTKEV